MASGAPFDDPLSGAGHSPLDQTKSSSTTQPSEETAVSGFPIINTPQNTKEDQMTAHASADLAKKPKIGTRQRLSNYFYGSDKREVKEPEETESARSQGNDADKELAALQTEMKHLREAYKLKIQSLENANSHLQRELSEAHTKTNQLFEQWTQGKVAGRWDPPPDDEIRRLIQNLDNDIADWGAKWAVKSLDVSQWADEALFSFAESLSPFVHLTEDGSLPTAVCRPSSKMRERIPGLLLSGSLWHTVNFHFFKNCFWCFPSCARTLQEVFSQVAKSDPREAKNWRCSLWRLSHPPETADMTSDQRKVREETDGRVADFCDALASHFEKTIANLLLRHESGLTQQDRTKQLRIILRGVASIATMLWTQDSTFELIDLEFIERHRLVFDVSSPFLQGHRQSRLRGVDDDDEINNGRKILIVARPGLVRIGDNRSSLNEGNRALARAIVWLDDLSKVAG